MRVATLMEYHDIYVTEILTESCQGLSVEQRIIVEGIHKEFKPLIEASLAPQQIQQLFGEIEKNATGAGGNRTVLGKGVDVAKKADEVINNIGKWLQNTTPVKNFDAQFDKLKNKINTTFPDSKILDGISKLGIYAKENPGKTAAIVGILTALASLAGGPVGGAIAGQILRGSVELLKGEKLSTAIGKGIKTAALGYLSGKAFEMLGKFVGGMRADSIPVPGAEDSGLASVNYGATKTLTGPGTEFKQTVQGFNVTVFPQEAEGINAAMAMIKNGEPGGFDALQTIAREIRSPEYKSAIKDIMAGARADQLANDGLLNWIKGLSQAGQAISQGAVAASTGTSNKKESVYRQTRPLSEGQVYMLFNRIEQLNEGPMDWMKKAGDWVGKKAANLTTKITADKLNSAWQKAGSPTDSAELEKFLAAQGVGDEIIKQTFQSMKISPGATPAEEPKQAASIYAQIKTDVQKLDKKSQKRIMAYLQKQLGTT
jgi:hypothetical protein